MTRNLFASAAFAALLSAGAWAAMASPASAAYMDHRCNADGCWTVRCSDDGAYCRRVWERDNYADRHYSTPSSYYRSHGYYDGNRWVPYDRDNYRRHWTCDALGGDCHWVYRSY